MKKNYEAPIVEKIAFQYRDQVVVASGKCIEIVTREHIGNNTCSGDVGYEWNNERT